MQIEPRMDAFSAVMWDVESDPIMRNPITLVCGLDAPPDDAIVLDRAERMSRKNPKLRERAIGNPFSLVGPRWEVDPNFDMSYHVQFERPERDGAGLEDVLSIAERITEADFDKSRPLWELHVVTGLADDQAALILKIHHSITDGEGGVLMMASLFDLQRTPDTDPGPMPPAPTPDVLNDLQRLQQGTIAGAKDLIGDVTSVAKGGAGLVKSAVTSPVATASSARDLTASAARLMAPAPNPLSDIWTERSMSVAFSVVQAPLAGLKAASKAAKVTLNDAYMAAISGGLYTYHADHGSHPEALRVNMPVSLRGKGGQAGGNLWVPARFPLPTNDKDPVTRMQELHPILLQARTEPALGLSSIVYKLMAVVPNPVTTKIDQAMMNGTDLAATNVPGPPIPLFFAGAQLTSMIPYAPKGGAATNLALMSYDGDVFIGINSDRAAVADPDALTDAIAESLEAVLAVGAAT